MAAPLRSTPRPSAPPASQTASVAEFRCLFTHDVKRKQKRWQDGFLKFHAFNSRVMVYDHARNHVGDTYWKDSSELHEGDELSLDRGVMVEVAEAMGITQTDLTPLFEKKPREQITAPPAHPPLLAAALRPYQRPSSVTPAHVPRAGSQLRHKSLNTLLGTSKGPVGKALPLKSPYEARKEQENEWAAGRAPKRQKTTRKPVAWRASSPVEVEDSSAKEVPPVAPRNPYTSPAGAPKARPASIVTLSSESDLGQTLASDVTLPSPHSGHSSRTKSHISPPASKTPKGHLPVPLPSPPRITTPKPPGPPSSPPVSASNRLSSVDFAVQLASMNPIQAPPSLPPRNPKAKSLRLSAGVKRGTLLCQSLPQQPSRPRSQTRILDSHDRNSKASSSGRREGSSASNVESVTNIVLPQVGKRKSLVGGSQNLLKKAKRVSPSLSPQEDILEDPEVVHGMMDQQLLVSPLLVEQRSITRRFIEFLTTDGATGNLTTSVRGLEASEPLPNSSTRATPAHNGAATSKPLKKCHEPQEPGGTAKCSTSVLEPLLRPLRELSPTQTEASNASSRTGSISPSKVPFSAGGFRRKSKKPVKKSISPTSEIPSTVTCDATVALPPHPLRSSRKGPLMSTTELASLLQKPKQHTKAHDPIEEDFQPVGKSPNRSFRRVRSENDAPIPSTAEDWEKRNLPKGSGAPTELELPGAHKTEAKISKLSGLAALVRKTDPRKKFQRTKSLTIETDMAPVVASELPSPAIDEDVGPWSTEAFDLFDWRPPTRDTESLVLGGG